jgi:hypothetical protein
MNLSHHQIHGFSSIFGKFSTYFFSQLTEIAFENSYKIFSKTKKNP